MKNHTATEVPAEYAIFIALTSRSYMTYMETINDALRRYKNDESSTSTFNAEAAIAQIRFAKEVIDNFGVITDKVRENSDDSVEEEEE